jgi:hypothetical protein
VNKAVSYFTCSIYTMISQGINSILFTNFTKLQLYMGTKVALMTLWTSCFWCWTLDVPITRVEKLTCRLLPAESSSHDSKSSRGGQ